MKSCPTCKKTFTDPSLSYCIDDGTPLVSTGDHDDELTEIGAGTGSAWNNPPPYQPPGYQPPGDKRRTWPWLVGIFGVLLLVLVGASIAAAIFIPRILKNSRESAASRNENTSQSSNLNSNSNSNSIVESTPETSANTNAPVNTPAPTDKELVLTQLKDLEQEWTVANLNADKKKLAQILGDDYVSPRADGKMQGKAEYIRTIERDTSVQSWEFKDLRLTLRGDRAILFGKITFRLADRQIVYDFVDRFVWRDGRWQATGSEITEVPN